MQEMQEMWVWCLGREDPLDEEMATGSSILPGEENSMDRGAKQATVHGVAKSRTQLSTHTSSFYVTSNGKSYKIIVQYQNQDVDVETVHWSYLNNPLVPIFIKSSTISSYVEVHVRTTSVKIKNAILSQGCFKLSVSNNHTQLPLVCKPQSLTTTNLFFIFKMCLS